MELWKYRNIKKKMKIRRGETESEDTKIERKLRPLWCKEEQQEWALLKMDGTKKIGYEAPPTFYNFSYLHVEKVLK